MSFQFIVYCVRDGFATITLNRPDKRNALSLELLTELHTALWEADEDTEVHAVLIKGAGPDFSAGYDLSGVASAAVRPRLRDTAYRRGGIYEKGGASFDDDVWRLEYSQRLRMAIFDMHKPVVAQVHGNCLAGGTDVALLCDMIIAASDARIGVPPVQDMGTTPNSMWLYHLGPQWAKRLMLTGDTVTGEDAAKIGLVMKAVPKDLLEQEVDSLMRRLGRIDADSLSVNKRIINMGLELMGARTLQRLTAESDARLHMSKMSVENRGYAREHGMQALLKRRKARFPDGEARVDRPELRDPDGNLLP